MRADVSVDWPTWSQTAYRSWSIGEPPDELPEVVIEVALRVQRMAEAPDTEKVMAALPAAGPLAEPLDLVRTATTIEQVRTDADGVDADGGQPLGGRSDLRGLDPLQRAAARGQHDHRPVFDDLTRWIASTLITLADLPFTFLPPGEDDT